MTPEVGTPVRVAWIHPVIAHYRAPIINKVAAAPGIELVNFAGQAKEGVSVDDASAEIKGPIIRLHNLRPFGRDARVVYAIGWTQVLTGGFNVVITHEGTHNITNWLLVILRRYFGYRLLVMGHIRPDGGKGRFSRGLRRLLVRSVDGIIAYTQAGAEQAIAWGVPSTRTAVMGNTLDLDRIERARNLVGSSAGGVIRERSRAYGGLLLLFVGRPTPMKRLDVAVDAVLELEQRGVDVTLVVIGDSAELSGMKVRATRTERIDFVGAVFDESELAGYFAAADFLFIPGAVGLAVVHAFAYGVPLLTALDVAHGPEMVIAQQGVNSVFVDQCDPQLFADAIEDLVASPERLRGLKDGAHGTQLSSADAMAKEIVAMVRKRVCN